MPADVLAKLNGELQKTLKNPELIKRARQGRRRAARHQRGGRREFLKTEYDKWKKVIADGKIKDRSEHRRDRTNEPPCMYHPRAQGLLVRRHVPRLRGGGAARGAQLFARARRCGWGRAISRSLLGGVLAVLGVILVVRSFAIEGERVGRLQLLPLGRHHARRRACSASCSSRSAS